MELKDLGWFGFFLGPQVGVTIALEKKKSQQAILSSQVNKYTDIKSRSLTGPPLVPLYKKEPRSTVNPD